MVNSSPSPPNNSSASLNMICVSVINTMFSGKCCNQQADASEAIRMQCFFYIILFVWLFKYDRCCIFVVVNERILWIFNRVVFL